MIVVVGEALVDLVVAGEGGAAGLGPDRTRVDVAAALGGAPFNVARTCGRLGADVGYVGAVSDDRFGTALLACLGSDGVDLGGVRRVSAPTTLAVAELSPHGAARYRFYVDGTSAPMLADPQAPPGTRVLVTGGLALVLEPMAQAVVDLTVVQPDDVLVVVDVNCRPAAVTDRDTHLRRVDAVAGRADVVKVSDEDLAYLGPDEEPMDVVRSLLRRGARAVLLTGGASGVTIVTNGGSTRVPAPAVDVVDTIGAGDAFVGAFVVWWTRHGNGRDELTDLDRLSEAVAASNDVASIVCTRRGADPPWRHKLAGPAW